MGNSSEFMINNGVLTGYTGCDSVVEIPDGVTEIRTDGRSGIFQGNWKRELKVKKIILPSSLRIIGKKAFYGCEWLFVIALHDGIEEIGEEAFYGCKRLKSLTIPGTVRKIAENAFCYCDSMTELIIPEGVEMLGSISHCARLEKITIPKSVTCIAERYGECGEFFLEHCPKIKTIEVADGNPVYHAINNCLIETERKVLISGGINSKIPEDGSVIELGSEAFCGREIKGSFVIPEGIVKIGMFAFNDCTNLEEIIFPRTIQYCGACAFENTSSIKRVYAQDAESWCRISFDGYAGSNSNPLNREAELFFGNEVVTDLIIPEGIERLGACTFSGCTSIASVTIPNTIKFFGKYTFANCDNLKSIYIDSLEAWLNIKFESSWNESLGNPLCNGGMLYIAGKPVVEFSLPDSITEIPDYSFCNYKELKKVYLHDGVITIGHHSFAPSTMLSMNCQNGWGVSNIPKSKTPLSIIINKKNSQDEIVEKIVACVDEGTNNLQALKIFAGEDIDYSKYDSFVINGAKRFKLNAEGKLRAAMYRLRYQNELDASFRDEYLAICQKGIKKIISIAIEENDADAIVLLFKVGAVLEKNKKAVLKLLSASSNANIKALATTIDQAVAAYESNSFGDMSGISHEEIEEHTPLGKEYYEKMGKAGAIKQLIKMGITVSKLPKVVLAENGETAPDEILQFILVSYGAQYINTKKYKFDFVEEADKAAALLNLSSLQKAMDDIYGSIDVMENPQVIVPYCRFADSNGIRGIISNIRKWHSWYEYGQNGRNIEAMAFDALMLSDSKEAMIYIDRKKQLDHYAAIRGTDADSIRDSVLTEFGLDEFGKKEYDLGSKKVIVTLNQDLSLVIYDTSEDKNIRSIPKKGTDPELVAKAAADFAEMKKNVKKVVKGRNDILFEDFLSGKTRHAKSWIASYTQNPILRRVAELIIWNQGKSTFILTSDGAVDCSGNTYEINKKTAIGVAHPIEMKKAEIEAWQKYFTSKGLKQPFSQIWEPVIDKDEIKEDRYKDCLIPFYRFKGQEKHGITVEDYNYHDEIYISFKDCYASVERIDWHRHEIKNDDSFEITYFSFKNYTRQVNHIVAYFDKISAYGRILKDDVSIAMSLNGFTLAQIMEFINIAIENNCNNCLATLMEYKDKTYSSYDPMSEFVLE